jgi:benzoylformate decarboxylase
MSAESGLNGCFDKILAASVTMFGSNGDGSPKAKPGGTSCAAEGGATFSGEATPARAAIPPARDPIGGEFAMHTIVTTMPPNAVVVEEAPSHRNALHEYFPIRTSGGFYACASGGLGWALPAALGAALADSSRKVVAVLGDGSSLYTIQGLWTAAQHRLPITFVILNNAGYAAVKSLGARLGIPHMPGSDVEGVDFVDVARGFGCRASRVERAALLAPALAQAFAANEPWLVDVRMDRAVQTLY